MQADDVKAIDLPFEDAILYFRDKVNLPTATWKDLWQGMHSRAFVVAGAMKADLLTDMRAAVDKAIAKGTTLKEFREDFDNIVAKHGWDYGGGRNWRSAVIFKTNVSVAYSAGQYRQMTDPDVLAFRPYWRYVSSSSAEKRPEHVAWYNTVLPWNHPWWQTHDPPNGWGCNCGKESASERELKRLIEEEKDGPHPIKTDAPDDGTYEWVDKSTGKVHRIPRGIDPGWDYSPGRTAWGEHLSEDVMDQWRALKGNALERLTPGSWETHKRPKDIPLDIAKAAPGPEYTTIAAAQKALEGMLGGEEKAFMSPSGQPVLVNASVLARHIDLNRTPFMPFIQETIEEPFEVWVAFEQHKGTGRVSLRQRFIKAVKLDKKRAMLVVVQAEAGILQAWTFIPASNLKYANNQRVGNLLWGRLD